MTNTDTWQAISYCNSLPGYSGGVPDRGISLPVWEDEFVVLTDCSDMRDIILFTEKMSNLTSIYNQNNGSILPLSYSWGVSMEYTGDTVPLSDMLIQSDRNMYDNKRAKKISEYTGNLTNAPA
jgi:hypothetical protein